MNNMISQGSHSISATNGTNDDLRTQGHVSDEKSEATGKMCRLPALLSRKVHEEEFP
jgi:hypothetical protein